MDVASAMRWSVEQRRSIDKSRRRLLAELGVVITVRPAWSKSGLGMFELVALVHLRHPAVHSAGFDFTLHQLLLLASNNANSDIVKNVVQHIESGLKFLLILDGWDEAPEHLLIPKTLPIIRLLASFFILFRPTLPSSSPLDLTPPLTCTTDQT